MQRDSDNNCRNKQRCRNVPSRGYCGNCCPACHPAPPHHNTLGGIQYQLQGAAKDMVSNNNNILFDTAVNKSSSDICYDSQTGEFVLPPNKQYYISWWAAVDGTGSDQNVELAVSVNHQPFSIGASPQVTCQVSGSALVTAGSSPEILTLVNISGNTIRYAATSVQANILILTISF